MSNLAPLGGVYQAGTLSGNPLAMAAGRATLDLLDQGAYDRLTSTSRRLAGGFAAAFTDVGLACVMPRIGSLLGVFFGDVEPTDFDEVSRLADNGVYPKVFHALLERGVAWAPGAYEALFPSLAHTDAVVDETILIAAEAAVAVASDLT
jgi:glutamate-1-semialdehyde 2,1-aminomutase